MLLPSVPEQILALYLLLLNLDFFLKSLLLPLGLHIKWVYMCLENVHFIVYFVEIVLGLLLLLKGEVNFVAGGCFCWCFVFVLLGFLGAIEDGGVPIYFRTIKLGWKCTYWSRFLRSRTFRSACAARFSFVVVWSARWSPNYKARLLVSVSSVGPSMTWLIIFSKSVWVSLLWGCC